MKKIIYALILSFFLHFLSFSLVAQNVESFIYGKITTFDDEVYEGQIRWGKEEAYWTDMFNASKRDNDNIDYLSDQELKDLTESKHRRNGGGGNNLWNKWSNNEYHYDFIHQFSCQFGEIKKIDLKRYKRAMVVMKDDSKIKISGEGYNDLEADIVIYDQKKGRVKLRWSELLMIEFLATPPNLESQLGKPLFGTVKTRDGIFVGQIQWDKDERVSSDILDGRNSEGKHKIEFEEIKAIEKMGDGCDITFKDGSDDYLHGSNDVDDGNRGIIVSNPAFGRVVISWKDFRKVEFSDQVDMKIMTYYDFQTPSPISGTIKTKNGTSHTGKIVYDLDESFEYEILNGEKGRLEFVIPFRNVSKIIPKRDECIVELKGSNQQLLLEDSQDINRNNEGVLVFAQSDKPVYINWKDVEEIVLD